MWTAIIGAITAVFSAIPRALDYLKLGKILKKDKNDKSEREDDMEHVEENDKAVKEIVEDGSVDDINDKFGWNE